MEKFTPLQETNAGKMNHCNKDGCTGCRDKHEMQQAVANHAEENSISILQLYYAALINSCSSSLRKKSQDSGYLHCT